MHTIQSDRILARGHPHQALVNMNHQNQQRSEQQQQSTTPAEQEEWLIQSIEAVAFQIALLLCCNLGCFPSYARYSATIQILGALLQRSAPPCSFNAHMQLLPCILDMIYKPDLLHIVLNIMDFNHYLLQQRLAYRTWCRQIPNSFIKLADETLAQCLESVNVALPTSSDLGARSMPMSQHPVTTSRRESIPVASVSTNPRAVAVQQDQTPVPPSLPCLMVASSTGPSAFHAVGFGDWDPPFLPAHQVSMFQNNQGPAQETRRAIEGASPARPTPAGPPTSSQDSASASVCSTTFKPGRVASEGNDDSSSLNCDSERCSKKRRVTMEPSGQNEKK